MPRSAAPLAVAAAIALTIAACTTHWTKAGATQADFERDTRACEHEASLVPKVVVESRFEQCMGARGYRKK